MKGKEFHQEMNAKRCCKLSWRNGFSCGSDRESKQAAIFALGVAKNGPIMTERTPGDGGETFGIKFQGLRMIGRSASMADLAFILEKVIPMSDPLRGDHPVVDETGLTGRFDFEVAWIPEKVLSDGGAPQIRKQ